jgi:hypothetical protein
MILWLLSSQGECLFRSGLFHFFRGTVKTKGSTPRGAGDKGLHEKRWKMRNIPRVTRKTPFSAFCSATKQDRNDPKVRTVAPWCLLEIPTSADKSAMLERETFIVGLSFEGGCAWLAQSF